MKLSTGWQTWHVPGRKENKFHCDPILEPGESIVLTAPNGFVHEITAPPGKYVKVHIAMSWDPPRDTLFVEEDSEIHPSV